MWQETDDALREQVTALARKHSIQINDSSSLESILRGMGDELRSGRLRDELGASNLPTLLLEVIKEASLAERMEALRVIANLCIDHCAYFFTKTQAKTD